LLALKTREPRPEPHADPGSAAGALDVAAALHLLVPADRWPTQPDPPVLVARVKRASRAPDRRPQVLITWTVKGDLSRVAAFRLTQGGRTLARRKGSTGRGAWVRRSRGRVTVTAVTATGRVLARGRVVVH
jgi:hypothetical protein